MKTKNIQYVLLYSLFLPAISYAGKSFYFFEILLFLLALFFIGKEKNIDNKSLFFFYVVFLISLLVPFLQLVINGDVHSASLLRLVILTTLVFFNISFFKENDSGFERVTSYFICTVSIIGIFQYVDGYILSNLFSFNRLVSYIYPYSGFISESDIAKTAGSYIKAGSLYRATSISDGHPILFGDMLALVSIFLLHWRKYLAFSLSSIAILLTFSRGSWLMLLVCVALYLFVNFKKTSFKKIFIISFAIFVLLVVVVNVDALYDSLYFRIANTLYTFGISDVEVGRHNDPRVDIVWPQFFNAMNENGIQSYIAGYNVLLPTDSGVFALLRESGVFGFIFFSLVFLFILEKAKFDHVLVIFSIVFLVGMLLHPVQQGYKTMFLSFLLIAYHLKKTPRKDSNVKA